MKKYIILLVMTLIVMTTKAQIPYFAGTAGDGNLYGYTSLKLKPGVNSQETYTTFQYGIGNRFATGLDLYTGPGCSYIGYTIRANAVTSKYFNLGAQITPSFDLNNSHKFSYLTGGLYMNGSITKDNNLFWVSNTWWGINKGAPNTINQWWYLGYYIDFKKAGGITPMVGLIHDWEFKNNPDLAVGAYYTYKKFNFYIWGSELTDKNPRLIIGVDFKLPTK